MDKNTLSNYGWIVIAVLVLSVMIALATPFGEYIKAGVESTTAGLFDTSEKALNVVGMSAGNKSVSKPITDYSLISGKSLDRSGAVSDKANYMVTDFIPCNGSYTYTVSENQTFTTDVGTTTRCLVYDADKNIIQNAYDENRTETRVYTHNFQTIKNAAYFRIQFRITDTDIVITENGSSNSLSAVIEYQTPKTGIMQGVAVSEKYIFASYAQSNANENKNKYGIRKMDRETGELIYTSTEYFNHCNGMAYNKNTNELIVCALNGDTPITSTTCDDDYSLFVVDADTLTLKETINLKDIVKSVCAESVGISGIAYSSDYNEYYALTRYPERHIITLNSDFTLKDSVYLYHYNELDGTTGDICFDGTYFYIPTWRNDISQLDNEIAIYSKDGEHIKTQTMYGSTHIEGMDVINGKFYISFISKINTHPMSTIYSVKSFDKAITIV